MIKEYFLTAPLLKSHRPIKVGSSLVSMLGQDGYSFIAGTTKRAIDSDLDDLICFLIQSEFQDLRDLQVVLRSRTGPALEEEDHAKLKISDWLGWAFSRIPLKDIPVAVLDASFSERIERALNELKGRESGKDNR